MVETESNNAIGISDQPIPQTPQLFVGITGGVGTDLGLVSEILARELHVVRYQNEEIRLSALLAECGRYSDLNKLENPPEHERITAFMDAGDDFRRTASRGDAVAMLAVGKVRRIRKEVSQAHNSEGAGRAYTFNSLKHPEEVELLRRVYGASFFLIAVYESREKRQFNLCEKIAKSMGQYDGAIFSEEAKALIDRDQKDVSDDLGQNVRDTFEKADLFVTAMERNSLERQIRRFVRLLFDHPFITPTVDEYCMFHAKAAALRSADLSRQVGAVVATGEGEILAAGCNEVPKPGGGYVWECQLGPEVRDNRDFVIGYDSSVRMAHELVSELLEKLSDSRWLRKKYRGRDKRKLAAKALFEGASPPLKGTRAASILEFGRVVHAEMAAITDAARRGVAIKDATLYCTTFPCHMCAKHIIAAGVARVVYIEPYPKSMTKILYLEAVNVDHESGAEKNAVTFAPFEGIAPRRYIELFEKSARRKDGQGRALEWVPEASFPRVRQFTAYLDLEAVVVELLETNQEKWGIIDIDSGEQHGEPSDG